MTRVGVIAALACLALVFYILEMVRRRKLREEYSILWLSGGIVMFVLVLRRDWLEIASQAVGIFYPPSFLFLVAIFFILLILIHFSITVSRLYQMNKRMAQELALLKSRQDEK
ncbi:MAG TPA: DUF2304 domain-containing protein [Candidatus Deferrimicrobiaceae bacterium]